MPERNPFPGEPEWGGMQSGTGSSGDTSFYVQQELSAYMPAELEALAVRLNITNLPPRPWTPRQRSRVETEIAQIQRRDYIYGGPPERRFPTRMLDDNMPNRFILQWNLDGFWADLRSFETYAEAESARDNVLRNYADDGVTFEDVRIVDTERKIQGYG